MVTSFHSLAPILENAFLCTSSFEAFIETLLEVEERVLYEWTSDVFINKLRFFTVLSSVHIMHSIHIDSHNIKSVQMKV